MNDCSDQDIIEDFVDFVEWQISRHDKVIDTRQRHHLGDVDADILVSTESGKDLYVYCCFSADLEATQTRAKLAHQACSLSLIVCIDWLDPSTPNLYHHPKGAGKIYKSGQTPIADAKYTFEWHWESIPHDRNDRCMQQRLNQQIGSSLLSTLQGHPTTIEHAQFEILVNAIFKFCFYPHLKLRGTQVPIEGNRKIRDAVYDIYHDRLLTLTPHWTPYITVEVKNMEGRVGQEEVDQLAKYLTPNGLGNFGILVSRKDVDKNGKIAMLDLRKEKPPKTIIHFAEQDLVKLINIRIHHTPENCIEYLLEKYFDLARLVL